MLPGRVATTFDDDTQRRGAEEMNCELWDGREGGKSNGKFIAGAMMLLMAGRSRDSKA